MDDTERHRASLQLDRSAIRADNDRVKPSGPRDASRANYAATSIIHHRRPASLTTSNTAQKRSFHHAEPHDQQ